MRKVKNSTGKEIVLPSGKIAIIEDFKGRHIREAQRVSEGDPGKFIFAMIAATTTIGGQPILLEDLDEMDGRDVLKLQTEFSAENF